ncbi:hypothetical protein B296_00032352 [Ensete ventricosum]|uniref:Uncharacterized protein n=1 Tax=Ensete ventricosum TaxID=4639 RepID=A0A426ZF77_ENSVE|nr:hypothetical protein B296_00032352 [Ensete ventricosum]
MQLIGLAGAFLHDGPSVSLRSTCYPTRCWPPNDDVNMFFHWPLGVWGRPSGPLDIAPEISLAYELRDMILEVMTLLVMAIILVETTILRPVYPGRVQRRRERPRVGWFRSIGSPFWDL